MARISNLILFLLLSSYSLQAQYMLTGKVCDYQTENPISGANVFLDATSIHTMTDENGIFKIFLKERINTPLIITHLGYNSISITDPFEEIPDIIPLEEKINVLPSIETVAPFFTREQKLEMFRNEFLGKTKAAKACEILNEDEIELFYDLEKKMLTASCNNPVRVLNNYLAYEIHIHLSIFQAIYDYDSLFEETPKGTKRISLDNTKQIILLGASSFIDLKPNNRTIKKRRLDTYRELPAFFLRSLANQKLPDDEFFINTNNKWVEAEKYFTIKDTLSLKRISLLPNTDIDTVLKQNDLSIYGKMFIKRKGKLSEIFFLTNSFLVDKMGNTDQVEKIHFAGEMSKQRVANMLPLDYIVK